MVQLWIDEIPNRMSKTPLTCQDALTPQVREGIALFNRGAFFEQHEVLEAAWMAEPGAVRDLYRGILQIGVGLLHRERGNRQGALNLLQYGIDRLAPFEPECMGVDVHALREAAIRLRAVVEATSAEDLATVDPALVPQVAIRGEIA